MLLSNSAASVCRKRLTGSDHARPRDLYNLNSSYGSEDALRRCVTALQASGLKVLCDAVLNHRCAHHQARRCLGQPPLLANHETGHLLANAAVIMGPFSACVALASPSQCCPGFRRNTRQGRRPFSASVHVRWTKQQLLLKLNPNSHAAQDKNGVWNQFGGRLAWDATAIVSDDAHFKGKGNRSTGDSFGAAPNIDHSQEFVRRDLAEWLQWLRAHAGYDGWRYATSALGKLVSVRMLTRLYALSSNTMSNRQIQQCDVPSQIACLHAILCGALCFSDKRCLRPILAARRGFSAEASFVSVSDAGRRFDFVRGFTGEAVREYLEAASSQFTVGEYWDSLNYNGGVPDYNQVRSRGPGRSGSNLQREHQHCGLEQELQQAAHDARAQGPPSVMCSEPSMATARMASVLQPPAKSEAGQEDCSSHGLIGQAEIRNRLRHASLRDAAQDAHRQRTVNWIKAAGGLATAFDVTTKGILHAVFEVSAAGLGLGSRLGLGWGSGQGKGQRYSQGQGAAALSSAALAVAATWSGKSAVLYPFAAVRTGSKFAALP